MSDNTLYIPKEKMEKWKELADQANVVFYAGVSPQNFIDEMIIVNASQSPILPIEQDKPKGRTIGIMGKHIAILAAYQMGMLTNRDIELFDLETAQKNLTEIKIEPIPNLGYEPTYISEYHAPGTGRKLNQRQKRKRNRWS